MYSSNYPPRILRQLGLIKFYQRLLDNVKNQDIPLLERLKFLCIASKNCDEFFAISYARLLKQNRDSINKILDNKTTVNHTLAIIRKELFNLHFNLYELYNNIIIPELKQNNIDIIKIANANHKQLSWIEDYFYNNIISILTILDTNNIKPFQKVKNKSLHFAVEFCNIDDYSYNQNLQIAILIAPKSLPRVIKLPVSISGDNQFILLQDIIIKYIHQLFSGMKICGCYPFRVTRNSDISLKHIYNNMSKNIALEVQKRKYADCSRLELDISYGVPNNTLVNILAQNFAISDEDIYYSNGPINLSRLIQLYDLVQIKQLKYRDFTPKNTINNNKNNLLDQIREHDILIHSPYHSFDPIIELTKISATKPNVLAIKITLYRTKPDSDIIKNLILAAKYGKEVIVSIELLARFDEESNIKLAQKLESAGVRVVYGVMGYKVHAKMLLVITKDKDKVQKYAHIGTGNYNIDTSQHYTDISILTNNSRIVEDIDVLFNQITGVANSSALTIIHQSPFNLFEFVLFKINNETIHALNNTKAEIIIKMNSLTDKRIIEAFYLASSAGVKIKLIIRGACSLIPQIKGLSENIQVYSVLGRFLEHQRIYYFYNQGSEDMYLSSADWMKRNFNKRIEICVPILDLIVKHKIYYECLQLYLDGAHHWLMDNSGNYSYKVDKFDVHEYLINYYNHDRDIIT